DTSTLLPAAPSRWMISIRSRRATGSVPVSGSSRNSTSGSCTSAWASLVRWRMPLEYPRMARSLFLVMPTDSSARSAAARDPGRAAQAGAGAKKVPAGHPLVERVLLRAEPDEAVEPRVVPDLLAQNAHLTLAGVKLTGGKLQQRGLAGAVGPEQAGHARRDPDRQLVEPNNVAVPLGNLVELHDRLHLSRSSDFTRKFRMHIETPPRTARTAADQYQGYCGPCLSSKN